MGDTEKSGFSFGGLRDALLGRKRPEVPVEAVEAATASIIETPQTQVAEVPAPMTVAVEAPVSTPGPEMPTYVPTPTEAPTFTSTPMVEVVAPLPVEMPVAATVGNGEVPEISQEWRAWLVDAGLSEELVNQLKAVGKDAKGIHALTNRWVENDLISGDMSSRIWTEFVMRGGMGSRLRVGETSSPVEDGASASSGAQVEISTASRAAVEAPVQASMVEAPTGKAEESDIPDWLKKAAERDPSNKVYEVTEYLEVIKRAMADLQGGSLAPEARRTALQSAAKANMEIRKLPQELLDLFVNARAVAGQNPNFSMNDFQREMVAAAKYLMGEENA